MSRYTDTLTARLTETLGEAWTVEADQSAFMVTHDNGSRALVWWAADGRRTATDQDTADTLARLQRKLAGELPKYTPEWAAKGTVALESLASATARAEGKVS